MSRILTRTLFVMIVAVVVLHEAARVDACGPFIERAVFTYVQHPDLPLSEFAAGKIGVVQPTYARSYLVIAYRHLSGEPLDAAARQGAEALWEERLDDGPKVRDPDTLGEENMHAWETGRREITTASTPLTDKTWWDLFRMVPGSQFEGYMNCQTDSFRRAALTLKALTARGTAAATVADWVRAQDTVFANCIDGAARIPAEISGATDADAVAQRAYQIAAAQFYSGHFIEAEDAFRHIADDPSSPWRTLAPYLVARTLVRRATLSSPEPGADRSLLARADAQIQSVLETSALVDVHPAALRLRGFVRFRLNPERRTHELAQALSGPGVTAGEFKRSLADYTMLLDKIVGHEAPASFDRVPAFVQDDAMTDWIVTFQTPGAASLNHAIQQWEQTKSVAWLTAVISKISRDDPRTSAVTVAAMRVRWGSPASPSLAYHAARLKIDAGQTAAARADVDAILGRRSDALPRSARNLFLSLRTRVAASIDEFLRFAQREPAGSTIDNTEQALEARGPRLAAMPGVRAFDQDAVAVLNDQLTLDTLAGAATNPILPVNLRRQLALMTWTRAVLLGRGPGSQSLAPVAGALIPAMRADLTEYAAARDENARAFLGVLIMLRFPGTRPTLNPGLEREMKVDALDEYRNNWWCAVKPASATKSLEFVSPADRRAATEEGARLRALGIAPNYLANEAARLAKLLPDDPRTPEALHLAVRATRFGCFEARTGAASRRAFDLLHQKYPNSPWTKKTPYWYGG